MMHKYKFSGDRGGYPINKNGIMKDLSIPMGLVLEEKTNIYKKPQSVTNEINDTIFDNFLEVLLPQVVKSDISKKTKTITIKN